MYVQRNITSKTLNHWTCKTFMCMQFAFTALSAS
jgi:hypothetical protein